jgi:hypothetical protein
MPISTVVWLEKHSMAVAKQVKWKKRSSISFIEKSFYLQNNKPRMATHMQSVLLQQLAEKKITKQQLCNTVEQDFTLLPELLQGISSPKANVRYSCAAVLADLADRYPEKLYPYMDAFVELLYSKNRILIWNAMAAVASLCTVDTNKKFDTMFDKYYDFINDEYLVTVANVVGNSAKIAKAKPYLTSRIVKEILKIENLSTTPHLTCECKLVLAQAAIETFNQITDLLNAQEKMEVLAFAKRHVDSPRKTLCAQAQKFLKKHE